LGSSSGWAESFVQDTIAADPSVLGLGNLVVRDKERRQPRAGRLDLLLQNIEDDSRFEVEIQLGPTDESHIIRTIEYWDMERRRFPQYEHTAVIVAEEITSRFFNVISLFNQTLPIVAIKLTALQLGDKSTLLFTRVLDYLSQGDEEDEKSQVTDRAYWEGKTSLETMISVDRFFQIVKDVVPSAILEFKKLSVPIKLSGQYRRLLTLHPRKRALRISLHIKQDADIEKQIDESGIDYDNYDERRRRYVLRLVPSDIKNQVPLLKELVKKVYIEQSESPDFESDE